jgi:hypothetical protein
MHPLSSLSILVRKLKPPTSEDNSYTARHIGPKLLRHISRHYSSSATYLREPMLWIS